MSKKKMLLLGDDLTLPSGIGTMSKEIVLGTIDTFDWVQIGGAQHHPREGQIVDLSEEINKKYGIDDAYARIYCVTGYGNPQILREIIREEKPDAILHFTDPRFWEWLYQMEREIRSEPNPIPILYYTIWDDLPSPMWNAKYYASSDSHYCISKQTYGILNRVLRREYEGEFEIHNEDGIFDVSAKELKQLEQEIS